MRSAIWAGAKEVKSAGAEWEKGDGDVFHGVPEAEPDASREREAGDAARSWERVRGWGAGEIGS